MPVQVPVGLSLAGARRAYRRRMLGLMVLALAVFAYLIAITRGDFIYDYRSLSFAAASGIVERCDYSGCDTPLQVTYYDNYFVDQYVDIDAGDCCYHPGQTLTVLYDPTGECADVSFGYADRNGGIAGDLVGVLLYVTAVLAVIWWHARRWRRRAEQAAAQPVAEGWTAVRIPTRTRRPLFRLTPDRRESSHGGHRSELMLAGLRRQLVTAVPDREQFEVVGQPKHGGVVALRAPGSPFVVWPAGRARSGWLQIDRYDVARVTSYVVPPIAAVLWHALAAHPSC
jgi:hypothetical protein